MKRHTLNLVIIISSLLAIVVLLAGIVGWLCHINSNFYLFLIGLSVMNMMVRFLFTYRIKVSDPSSGDYK